MISVIKETGEREPFDEQKILNSIKRVGIPKGQEQEVLSHVKSKVYEGIKTSEIFNHVSEFLKENHPYAHTKYNLKRAIMDLGPTGYPFEDFVASVLTNEGYTTQVRQILNGECITHEIDVVAKKDKEKIMVEAKFHNEMGIKTDTHVALYTEARFEDVRERNGFTKVMLATNTKITTEALDYAKCKGVLVLSWSYPEGEGLRDLIEKYRLIPVTVLTSLTSAQKRQLIDQGVGLCQAILKRQEALDAFNLAPKIKEEVLKEAAFVCS